MNTEFSIVASMFKTDAEAFEKAMQGISPERWLARPDNDANHLMWMAGHVVVDRAIAAKILGLQRVSRAEGVPVSEMMFWTGCSWARLACAASLARTTVLGKRALMPQWVHRRSTGRSEQ
jgi:hypothetical protein